jgi:photosynthetic reaction center H subunit
MHDAFFYGDTDITEIILSVFVLFFLGLIIYLRREDRREGYPLEDDVSGRLESQGGLLFSARPKTFILPHGEGVVSKPNSARDTHELAAGRTSRAPGTPFEPIGDPMLAGVGPGSVAQRARKPDVMFHGAPKIVPMRIAEGFSIQGKNNDPRGMTVIGADGKEGGVVTDVWIDRAEVLIRYLEVEVAPAKRVLTPMTMAVLNTSSRTVRVGAILGSQFAAAPTLEHPDQITLYEEERVCAYYGGGLLYATAERTEPYL